MKKPNSNLKNLLWTLVSVMTLAFILIAIYSIGIKFTSTQGNLTVTKSFTFNDIIENRDNSVFTFNKETYGLWVSALFFGALTTAVALIFLILNFFTKKTKLAISGKFIDFTLLILVITSVTLAIAGSAYFMDKWLNMPINKAKDYKLEAGSAAGHFIILAAPLLFLPLPLTCDMWFKKNKKK